LIISQNKLKEMEIEVNETDQIIEQKAKSNEIEGRKEENLVEERKGNIERLTKKGGNEGKINF